MSGLQFQLRIAICKSPDSGSSPGDWQKSLRPGAQYQTPAEHRAPRALILRSNVSRSVNRPADNSGTAGTAILERVSLAQRWRPVLVDWRLNASVTMTLANNGHRIPPYKKRLLPARIRQFRAPHPRLENALMKYILKTTGCALSSAVQNQNGRLFIVITKLTF